MFPQLSRVGSKIVCRRFATTAPAASQFQELYTALKEVLEYHQLNRDRKNLVYLKERANELRGMEIYDDKSGVRIVPKDVPGVPKQNVFSKLILSAANTNQLQNCQDLLLGFAKYNKKNHKSSDLAAVHFSNLLIAAVKLKKLPHVLSWTYSNLESISPYVTNETIELIYVLNSVIKNNALGTKLGLKEFLRKLEVPIANIHKGKAVDEVLAQDPKLALTYLAALISFSEVRPKTKPQTVARVEEVLSLINLQDLKVPDLTGIEEYVEKKKLGKLIDVSISNQFDYLTYKVIVEQFQNIGNETVVSRLEPFVSGYEKAAEVTGRKSLFETLQEESKFGKSAVEPVEESK